MPMLKTTYLKTSDSLENAGEFWYLIYKSIESNSLLETFYINKPPINNKIN